MAFAHCHKCNWSQDDFWTRTYNPLTQLIGYIKPRIVKLDDWIIEELNEEKWFKIPHKTKNGQSKTFSWFLLLRLTLNIPHLIVK